MAKKAKPDEVSAPQPTAAPKRICILADVYIRGQAMIPAGTILDDPDPALVARIRPSAWQPVADDEDPRV